MTNQGECTEPKVNLGDLSKLPAKEFEKQFRDWMERDDVARGLQAQLRTDLIKNFNKTALGKQILSQTTTTTGAYGGSTQRLTLNPLVLALNTLVAEFLYSQNCHFSLSVFCTEVPFRNTLPDFESTRFFRFTEPEISEIFEAITGAPKSEKNLKNEITKNYVQNGNTSLLLFILKALLENRRQDKAPEKPLPSSSPLHTETQPTPPEVKGAAGDKPTMRHDTKTEIYNTNFRYLNKYLIILSKKVKEMAQQFENLQQQRQLDPTTARAQSRPRLMKSVRTRKYENLYRSLERITENLKQVTHAKRKSKRIGAIVNAIDALATQFAKCATNFDNVSQGLLNNSRKEHEEQKDEKHTEAEVRERSYVDWVHEMRHTKNGQKFLDRIEISLRKALNKQKEQLQNETDVKLRHQKELLKIRYKQRLMEHLSNHAPSELTSETRKFNENIELQLKQFETKHFELLHKIKETETKNVPVHQQVHVEKIVEVIREKLPEKEPPPMPKEYPTPIKIPATTSTKPNPAFKDAINTQKQLQEIVKSMTRQERNVNHIVYDAKLRIRELENESNQLDKGFRDYLERQRMQKEAACDETARMCHNYNQELEQMRRRYENRPERRQEEESDEEILTNDQTKESKATKVNHKTDGFVRFHADFSKHPSLPVREHAKTDIEFKNAILEAKQKFFAGEEKFKQSVEKIWQVPDLNLNDLDVPPEDPYFYNSHFQSPKGATPNQFPATSDGGLNSSTSLSFLHVRDQTLENEIDLSATSTSARMTFSSPEKWPKKTQANNATKKLQRQLFATEKTTATLHQNYAMREADGGSKNRNSATEVPREEYSHSNNKNVSRKTGNKANLQQNKQQLPQLPAAALRSDKDNAKNIASKKVTTTPAAATTITKTTSKTSKVVLQQSMAKMKQLFAHDDDDDDQEEYEEQPHVTELRPKQIENENGSRTQAQQNALHVGNKNGNVAFGHNTSNHNIQQAEVNRQQNENSAIVCNTTGIVNDLMATMPITTTIANQTTNRSQEHTMANRLIEHVASGEITSSAFTTAVGIPSTTTAISVATGPQLSTGALNVTTTSESSTNVVEEKGEEGGSEETEEEEREIEEVFDEAPLEIGEIVDSFIINLTNPVAESEEASSSASSIELQLSTGGGSGRNRHSDSGSEFWQ